MTISRGDSLGVPGEHGRLPDVVEAEIEHADALHPDAAASVWGTAVSERVNVRPDRIQF